MNNNTEKNRQIAREHGYHCLICFHQIPEIEFDYTKSGTICTTCQRLKDYTLDFLTFLILLLVAGYIFL